MASWASITAKPRSSAAEEGTRDLTGKRISVVDANAIISLGSTLASLGEVLLTTEEVLAEVKDSASRAALAQLQLVCQEPSDSAVRIISAFAKKTGDFHQLSGEDLRILALTYTLEAKVHGTGHLRDAPAPVRVHTKRTVQGVLPGWGNNGASDDWDAIDSVPDPGPLPLVPPCRPKWQATECTAHVRTRATVFLMATAGHHLSNRARAVLRRELCRGLGRVGGGRCPRGSAPLVCAAGGAF